MSARDFSASIVCLRRGASAERANGNLPGAEDLERGIKLLELHGAFEPVSDVPVPQESLST